MISPALKKCFVQLLCLCAAIWGTACAEINQLNKPAATPYYGNVAPPAGREFRWANGEAPKTFDPALSVLPSEKQAVRAAFEGLTEWDAKTLEAAPAVAFRWESTEDFRTWTFYLRPNAIWTNGKKITARDFARSWQRLAEMGEKSPNSQIISNIVGAKQVQSSKFKVQSSVGESVELENESSTIENQKSENENPKPANQIAKDERQKTKDEFWFGVEALDEFVLRVYLIEPDKDFPRLAAHSALRPVYENTDFEKTEAAKIITNGAFRFVAADKNGVTLERSKNYWNVSQVKLERVRFVSLKDANDALAAYRAGEVDAVTNAHFEPLALKLLASYTDFERTTFNAVTFYEFNKERPHFKDRRVREALAIVIDRERLANDELDGSTVPANKFLPQSASEIFKFDIERAKNLLAEAGFPNGKDFPKIRLLVNRNDAQNRLAKAVAAQWRKNLNIETEITQSSLEEINNPEATKDFDLVRRVVMLPTTDEASNLQAMFGCKEKTEEKSTKPAPEVSASPQVSATPNGLPLPLHTPNLLEENAPEIPKNTTKNGENAPINKSDESNTAGVSDENAVENQPPTPILTEAQAAEEIPAIPLYFPLSYALVKPYVAGFEPNLLDAPMLKDVEIQTSWKQ